MKHRRNREAHHHKRLDDETDALRGMLVTAALIAAAVVGIAYFFPVK